MFLKAGLSIVQGRSTKSNMQLYSKREIDELSNFRQQMGKKGSERQRERKTSGLRPCLTPQTSLMWSTLFNIASDYHFHHILFLYTHHRIHILEPREDSLEEI